MRPSSPRSSSTSSTTARYSRSRSRVRLPGGTDIRTWLEVHAQHAVGIGRGAAEHGAVQRHQGHREAAPAEAHSLRHFCHDADMGVGMVVPRHQQHLTVAADVHRQRSAACPEMERHRPGG